MRLATENKIKEPLFEMVHIDSFTDHFANIVALRVRSGILRLTKSIVFGSQHSVISVFV